MALDVKVFCKISDYLSQAYPSVARLLNATCTEGSLGTRGKPGTTFLVPQDAAVISKLEKLAQSANTDDVQLASDMLSMFIVRDHFTTGADWKNKEPVTALDQVLDVASTGQKEVVFKNGAKAVLDTNFKDGSKGKNLAVWKLTGEIPVTSDRPSTGKAGKVKTGGYLQSDQEAQTLRNRIMIIVENEFAEYLRESGPERCDPFVKYLFSFINWCRYNVGQEDKDLLHKIVIPILCLDRVDLYFLIEPHKPRGQDYLIKDKVIADWWAGKYFDISPMQTCDELTQSILHPEVADDSLFYADRTTLLSTIATLRDRLKSSADSRPRAVIDQIHKQYLDLAATNSLNGGKVFPTELADYYKTYPMLKMVQDELRFITHWKFAELCSNRGSNPDLVDLEKLFNIIGEMLYTCYAGSGKSGQRLLNVDTIKYSITPTETIDEVKIFINSTAFMHVAMTPDECKRIASKQSGERPKTSKILFNIAAGVNAMHQRMIDWRDSSDLKNSTVARLLMVDVSTLPEELREKLRKKFS